jgi:hypothetical protein
LGAFAFCSNWVPIDWLHEGWAQKIHSQSLDRLNERGGPAPILGNMDRLPFDKIVALDYPKAIPILIDYINQA